MTAEDSQECLPSQPINGSLGFPNHHHSENQNNARHYTRTSGGYRVCTTELAQELQYMRARRNMMKPFERALVEPYLLSVLSVLIRVQVRERHG